MNKAKILAVLLFFLSFPTCEKVGTHYFYIPKLECNSDWLTNPYYHKTVYKQPAIKNTPESFTAIINGKPWRADSSVSASYYNGHASIGGYNKDYWIVIHFDVNDFANAKIYALNYSGSKILEKEMNLVGFDTINGTVSINFKAKLELHTSYPVQISQIVIEDGKIEKVKFEKLFCRPDYLFQNKESTLKGIWHLIEITNCTTNSQYYPPCDYNPFISFDTLNSGLHYPPVYEHYVSAWCGNEFSPSYKFLNDTTIVLSTGPVTQVGVTAMAKDFEKLFFSLLDRDTMIIKKNKNLLEIKKRGNIFLRFYR